MMETDRQKNVKRGCYERLLKGLLTGELATTAADSLPGMDA